MKFSLLSALCLLLVTTQSDATAQSLSSRANDLAQSTLLIDGHVDLPYRLTRLPEDVSKRTDGGDVDVPRMRDGGLNAAFLAVYLPTQLQKTSGASRDHADRIIDLVEGLVADHPETFVLARSPEDVRAAMASGRIALPLGMENGSGFEDDLALVSHFYDRGIRYVTLTHGRHNQIGDSSYDDRPPRWGGLSPFGRDLVRAFNRTGIMVDVSHVTDATARDVLDVSEAPVIASHSSCRVFTPGWERNLPDDLIRGIANSGGLVMINFGSNFLRSRYKSAEARVREETYGTIDARGWARTSPEALLYRHRQRVAHPIGSVADVADHIDHVVDLVGIEHVGIGSDFDGIFALPKGLQDAADYPNLIEELLRRGYFDEDVAAIFGENLLRVWTAVERHAREP